MKTTPGATVEVTVPAVSIVVLAYNEAGSLAGVVRDIQSALTEHAHEIVIVDDGSTDDTASIASGLAALESRIRVVRHTINRGGGAASRTGLMACRGDLVAVVPGDGQFVAYDLPSFIDAAQRADVVISRRRNRTGGSRRRVSSWCYRTVIWAALGLRVGDLNWVKMYRRMQVQALPLTAESWLIDAEILFRLSREGRSFTEIEVMEMPRRGGTSTGGDPRQMLAAARELWRFRRRLSAELQERGKPIAERRGRT